MGKSSFLPEENSRTQASRLGGVKLAVSGQQRAYYSVAVAEEGPNLNGVCYCNYDKGNHG